MPKPQFPKSLRHWSLVILMAALLPSCKSPDKANIQLRRDKQQLQSQIEELNQQLQAARARIVGLEGSAGSVPTLPADRLDKLFTVHGIKIGRLTGGNPATRPGSPDEGIKVYLSPIDQTGEEIKATGTLEVEAFDLEFSDNNRIGRWVIDPNTLKSRWRSLGMLEAYVIELPWQQQPQHPKLALKIRFRDELTGRVYDAIREITVRPPTTKPATRTVGAQ
jgi:hypothetical protein